jgi:hypothetical protein
MITLMGFFAPWIETTEIARKKKRSERLKYLVARIPSVLIWFLGEGATGERAMLVGVGRKKRGGQ